MHEVLCRMRRVSPAGPALEQRAAQKLACCSPAGERRLRVPALPVMLALPSGPNQNAKSCAARRRMGKVFEFLGMTVAVVRADDNAAQLRAAFSADVVYITAQQLAFTYLGDNALKDESSIVHPWFSHFWPALSTGQPGLLPACTFACIALMCTTRQRAQRDSMALSQALRMQAITRPWNYAIVDEVDSVLIDECRNPMIMALPNKDESVERYKVAAQVSTLGSCASMLPWDGAWLLPHMGKPAGCFA